MSVVAAALVALVALIHALAEPIGFYFQVFFLGCVIVAGIYGGLTVSRRIIGVQALPAAIALVAVILAAR